MPARDVIARFIAEEVNGRIGAEPTEGMYQQADEILRRLRADGYVLVGPTNATEVVPEFEGYIEEVRPRW